MPDKLSARQRHYSMSRIRSMERIEDELKADEERRRKPEAIAEAELDMKSRFPRKVKRMSYNEEE